MTDYLDAGRVGLYEFAEALREKYPDQADTDRRRIASAALDRLLEEADVHLVRLRWADTENWTGPATRDQVTDAVWDGIGDDPYLAIIRT